MQATKLKQQNYILENNKNEDMREYGSRGGKTPKFCWRIKNIDMLLIG